MCHNITLYIPQHTLQDDSKNKNGQDKGDENGKSDPKATLLTYNFDIVGQKTLWKVNPRPSYSAEVSQVVAQPGRHLVQAGQRSS